MADNEFVAGFTTADVVAKLRAKNDAVLGVRAYLCRLKAATQRMGDYIEAADHAHETRNLEEVTGLTISLSAASRDVDEALRLLDSALEREKSALRAAA